MEPTTDLIEALAFKSTMQALERVKRVSATGIDYWRAREIFSILGYTDWDGFMPVVMRAKDACATAGLSASHHIRQTSVMMKVGKGAQRSAVDYFLTRGACYLVAMNGDPSKAEIAAAQAYFAVQARRSELEERKTQDLKRLELRQKVSQSHKRVSGVAHRAGVRSTMQGVFHDQRFRGLYNKTRADVARDKGLEGGDNFFDHAGPLELSAHDFQMNLAADVIDREKIEGENPVIQKNYSVAQEVRAAIKNSGATLPEDLPLDEPIATVKKRLKGSKRLAT